jgi:hypothetical protein
LSMPSPRDESPPNSTCKARPPSPPAGGLSGHVSQLAPDVRQP